MQKQKLFSYTDYDKISDDLYYIGGGARLVLRMNVNLAKKMDDGSRRHFYNEYRYDSKYNDAGSVVSIKRSYDYYITLESMSAKASGVMIRPQDMILLRSRFSELVVWFSNGTYGTTKGKLIVKKHNRLIIDGFPEKKSILFEPVVIDYEDGNQTMGIRITLSGVTYSDVSIDKIYGLIYTLECVNMIQCAQSMLAFMGMPEFGTNRYEIDNTDRVEPEKPKNIVKDREFKPKGKSYFDMIDGLSK